VWEERYGTEEYAYGKQANDFLVEQLDKIPLNNTGSRRVLCLAEGEGRNAVYLAKQGYDIVAVDASSAGMQKAQRLALDNGVTIKTVVSDLAEFEIEPESYDAVVSIFCHLPLELRQKIHAQVVKSLRPGGVFLLEAYTPDQLKFKTGGPPVAELTMKLDDLLDEIQGLDVISAIEKEREVIEGLYHTGMGAVVQLVAKKT